MIINFTLFLIVFQAVATLFLGLIEAAFNYALRRESDGIFDSWQKAKWEGLWRLDGSKWGKEGPFLTLVTCDGILGFGLMLLVAWLGYWMIPVVLGLAATFGIRWYTGRTL